MTPHVTKQDLLPELKKRQAGLRLKSGDEQATTDNYEQMPLTNLKGLAAGRGLRVRKRSDIEAD